MRTFGIDDGYMWFFIGRCYQFHLTVGLLGEVFFTLIFIEFMSDLETSKFSHSEMLHFENTVSFFLNLIHELGPFCC